MALQAIKVLMIGLVGVAIVCAQNDGQYHGGDDGRYRPSNEGKYTGNDGRYVHQDNKYQHTKDTFESGGGPSNVVKIGGRTTTTKATTTKKTTTEAAELPPLAAFPTTTKGPPVFIVDTRSEAINANQDGEAQPNIKILRQEQEDTEDGYHYLFETENGILAEQTGQIEKTETGDDVLRATGFYQYVGDDGQLYRVDYTADAINGFVPKGDHLPTPPPIPPEIQELLQTLATKPPDDA